MKYNCKKCIYSTNNKEIWSKHLLSESHCKNLEDYLIQYYDGGTLDKHICAFICSHLKKSDYNQSLWITDRDDFNSILNSLLGNKTQSKIDKNSSKFKESVVGPFLSKLSSSLKKFVSVETKLLLSSGDASTNNEMDIIHKKQNFLFSVLDLSCHITSDTFKKKLTEEINNFSFNSISL